MTDPAAIARQVDPTLMLQEPFIMSHFQSLLVRFLPEILRRILRYVIGALAGIGVLTAMQGEQITNDPEVQIAMAAAASALAAWLVEQAANAAKRWGLRDDTTPPPIP